MSKKIYYNPFTTSVKLEKELVDIADSLGIVRNEVFSEALEKRICEIVQTPNARVTPNILDDIHKYFTKKTEILDKKHNFLSKIVEKQRTEQAKLTEFEEHKEKIRETIIQNFQGGFKKFKKWLPEEDVNFTFYEPRIQLCKQLSGVLGFEVTDKIFCQVIKEGLKEAST